MRAVDLGTLAVLAVVLSATCQHAEDRYLDREVAPSEIVGSWRMAPEAVKDLHDVGYTAPLDPSTHQITLMADGTCRFNTFTTALTTDGKPSPVVEAPCRWKLAKLGHQVLLIDLESNPAAHAHYYFGKATRGDLALWQHASDPDAWRYVEYVKE
jgi:hypothetical protein